MGVRGFVWLRDADKRPSGLTLRLGTMVVRCVVVRQVIITNDAGRIEPAGRRGVVTVQTA